MSNLLPGLNSSLKFHLHSWARCFTWWWEESWRHFLYVEGVSCIIGELRYCFRSTDHFKLRGQKCTYFLIFTCKNTNENLSQIWGLLVTLTVSLTCFYSGVFPVPDRAAVHDQQTQPRAERPGRRRGGGQQRAVRGPGARPGAVHGETSLPQQVSGQSLLPVTVEPGIDLILTHRDAAIPSLFLLFYTVIYCIFTVLYILYTLYTVYNTLAAPCTC